MGIHKQQYFFPKKIWVVYFQIAPDIFKFLPIFVGWIGHVIIGVIKPHVLSMT